MGLSASQARFLQLTARKSNVEYQAQQINQQRLLWSTKLEQASNEYNDKISNRKMVFNFNNGSNVVSVDVTYSNYKNYMNQQMKDTGSVLPKYYLVSSSGNKIVVGSAEDRDSMIARDSNELKAEDFMIVDNLDDVDNFQKAIQEGIYRFATIEEDDLGNKAFSAQSWEGLGGGAIKEEYDKTDDAAAEAEYQAFSQKIQNIDKKLELELDRLENERNAIQTEMDSVQKVVEDNIEKTFQIFS